MEMTSGRQVGSSKNWIRRLSSSMVKWRITEKSSGLDTKKAVMSETILDLESASELSSARGCAQDLLPPVDNFGFAGRLY